MSLLLAAGDNYFSQCGMDASRHPVCVDSDASDDTQGGSGAASGSIASLQPFHSIETHATIVGLACGDRHTLAVTSTGLCLTTGSNRHCQLGISPTDTAGPTGSSTFRAIPVLAAVKVAKIAAGACHSAAISEAGRVYTWGSNTNAACGIGKVGGDVKTPQRLRSQLDNEMIVDVSCGFGHTCLRSHAGDLYAFGCNRFGQCGVDAANFRNVPQPRLVSQLRRKVEVVACGRHHTLAITRDGLVYGWGASEGGRLGIAQLQERHRARQQELATAPLKDLPGDQYTPMHVAAPTLISVLSPGSELIGGAGVRITQAAGGWYHSLFLASNGWVLGAGDASFGQLGMRPANEDAYYSTVVRLFRVDGGVSLADPLSSGELFALWLQQQTQGLKSEVSGGTSAGPGADTDSKPGAESAASGKDAPPPREPFSLPCRAVGVHAGLNHSCVVTEDGRVLLFGGGLACGTDLVAADARLLVDSEPLPMAARPAAPEREDEPTLCPVIVGEYCVSRQRGGGGGEEQKSKETVGSGASRCGCELVSLVPGKGSVLAVALGGSHTVLSIRQ